MKNFATPMVNFTLSKYKTVAKKLMRLVSPYGDLLNLVLWQDDTMCIYTLEPGTDECRLFVAVQIVSAGVTLTVYDPGVNHRSIFENLPARLAQCYLGNYKFRIQKYSAALADEISGLLSALYGMYSIERFDQFSRIK